MELLRDGLDGFIPPKIDKVVKLLLEPGTPVALLLLGCSASPTLYRNSTMFQETDVVVDVSD